MDTMKLFKLLKKYENSDLKDKSELVEFFTKESNQSQSYLSYFDSESKEYKLIKNILLEIDNAANESCEKENVQTKSTNDDIKLIREAYEKWLVGFEKNNFELSEEGLEICRKIVNFYIANRFEVLEKVLSIYEDENFKKFKNILKNLIRERYKQIIDEYTQSSKYKSLSFFKKMRKGLEVEKIKNKIAEYDFNNLEISEVLK